MADKPVAGPLAWQMRQAVDREPQVASQVVLRGLPAGGWARAPAVVEAGLGSKRSELPALRLELPARWPLLPHTSRRTSLPLQVLRRN